MIVTPNFDCLITASGGCSRKRNEEGAAGEHCESLPSKVVRMRENAAFIHPKAHGLPVASATAEGRSDPAISGAAFVEASQC